MNNRLFKGKNKTLVNDSIYSFDYFLTKIQKTLLHIKLIKRTKHKEIH